MSQSPFCKAKWYERDERFLWAHHQPALLLDLLQARNLSSHKLLKGTGLFYEDILTGTRRISPHQFLVFIQNTHQLCTDTDVSFRWGSTLWPGHYGEFSQLLSGATNLRHALDILSTYRKQLCPLLVPNITTDQHNCYIQWQDAVGLGSEQQFVVEAYMTGLANMVTWLSKSSLPWHYCFDFQRPTHDSEYQVHFGERLNFSIGVNAMIVDKVHLDTPWPNPNASTAHQVLLKRCEQLSDQPVSGFIEAVFRYLLEHIQHPPSLDQTANAFSMSSATFKRKLKKHHWQFQKLQDKARLHVSLYLFHINGWNNDQVADYLNFNDLTNFRRAFKRWSGFTPSDCRALFSLN